MIPVTGAAHRYRYLGVAGLQHLTIFFKLNLRLIEPIRERSGAVPPALRVSLNLKVKVPPPRNGVMSLSLCTSTYF